MKNLIEKKRAKPLPGMDLSELCKKDIFELNLSNGMASPLHVAWGVCNQHPEYEQYKARAFWIPAVYTPRLVHMTHGGGAHLLVIEPEETAIKEERKYSKQEIEEMIKRSFYSSPSFAEGVIDAIQFPE